ncbi:MAG: hypothetical protein ACR2GD_13570 [Pyrinomonadaceae bacterium]
MKRKIFNYLMITTVLFSLIVTSFAGTRKVKKIVSQTNQPTDQLVAKLPASDVAARIDLQRLMNVALPQILNAKPQMLTGINAKIDEIKSQTGIDLRQFDELAVGAAYSQTASKNFDLQPVALASGKYEMNALLTVMKLAAKDKFREERVGAKTIYIFSPREIVPNKNPQNAGSSIILPGLGMIINLDKIFAGEMAVAALDAHTLAFGNLARVRQTLENKPRLGQDILALVNRNPNAVISFGANMPPDFARFLNMTETDEIGKNINSIRQMYGALDADGGSAQISVTAKTANAKQAEDLESTVAGLQTLGKSVLGGMRGSDKAVYARMAENARITRAGSEVMLNLQVPQSDIDVLLGKK